MKKDTNLLNTQDVRAEAATALTPNATNGEKIKALRTAQGMSMAELSRRASMSDRAIRYIEAGEREPSVDAIQKIAAALGVTTDYFMDDATFQKELSDDQFYADVRKKYGSRGVAQAKKIKEQTSALFAGGELSEEDQANFIKEMEGKDLAPYLSGVSISVGDAETPALTVKLEIPLQTRLLKSDHTHTSKKA